MLPNLFPKELCHFSRFHIYVLIYDICFSLLEKNVTYEPICRGRNRDTDVENELVDTVGKERLGQFERAAFAHTHDHM